MVPSVELLEAFLRSRDEFAELLGATVPEGWPAFPEIIPFTLDIFRERGDQTSWWTHLFLDQQEGSLIGSGGLKGPPVEGVAEIGYEIAPIFRGRGYATEAAALLIEKAIAGGAFTAVDAHTLAAKSASVAVLQKLDFRFVRSIEGGPAKQLWHWRRPTPDHVTSNCGTQPSA